MIKVIILDKNNEQIDITDLTDVAIGEAIADCKRLIDSLEDAHRAYME